MASKKVKVKGIEVELWKASFRLPGMHRVFFPTYVSEETVTEFIEAVYSAVEKQAIESGKKKLIASVAAEAEKILGSCK